ncbi:peptide/nickel transport system permease protein [Roseomonas rosea]|uniref:Peptide/nickel transport system permease protein n=1 Tax=Muricoccus roseus TaxID=198092 RepID=A0A1M6Q211_9PROT|nr:ABC transporter permease [Roseomonas rosea]SHK14223.1 peptide/nickel transport system permease protein [Roseomonas rosea]
MKARLGALAATAASIPITLLGLAVVTFFIGRVVPIDPVLAVVGDRAPADVVERARIELGLDQPLLVQFWRYLTDILTGNLGRSVMTSNTVWEDIARFFPATFELATFAILVAAILGIGLGVLAATRQGSWADQAVRVFCLAGHSLPVFVLGLISLLVFYAWLGWLPGPGRQGIVYQDMVEPITGLLTLDAALANDWPAFWDAVLHLIQPAGILAFFSLAYIARMTRAFMLAELRSEYVTTARAKGLSSTRIVWRHAFRNTLVPLVTVIFLTYAGLLEGAVLTETIFAWPGLGQYLTVSLLNADMNAVLGATLVVGLIYVVLNLLADLLYRLMDPRTR